MLKWIKNNPDLKDWFAIHFKEKDGHFLWDEDFKARLRIINETIKRTFNY